jgi:hypothetical protein
MYRLKGLDARRRIREKNLMRFPDPVTRELSDLEVRRIREKSLMGDPALPVDIGCHSMVCADYYEDMCPDCYADKPSNIPPPRTGSAPAGLEHVALPPLPAPKHANAVPYPIPAPAPSQADVEAQCSQEKISEKKLVGDPALQAKKARKHPALPAKGARIIDIYSYKTPAPKRTGSAPAALKYVALPPLPAPGQADVKAQRKQITASEFVENYAKMLNEGKVSGPIDFLLKVIRNFSMFSNYDITDFTTHLHTAMLQIVNEFIKNKSGEKLVEIVRAGAKMCDSSMDSICHSCMCIRTCLEEFGKSIAAEFLSYMSFMASKIFPEEKHVLLSYAKQYGTRAIWTSINTTSLENWGAVIRNPGYNAAPVITERVNQLLAKRETLPLHGEKIERGRQMITDIVKIVGNFVIMPSDVFSFGIKYGVISYAKEGGLE